MKKTIEKLQAIATLTPDQQYQLEQLFEEERTKGQKQAIEKFRSVILGIIGFAACSVAIGTLYTVTLTEFAAVAAGRTSGSPATLVMFSLVLYVLAAVIIGAAWHLLPGGAE